MKIIFSANSSFYLYKFRLSVLKELKKNGHDIHVVAPKDKYSKRFFQEGITFHSIHLKPTSMNFFTDFKSLIELIKIYNRIKPEIVFNSTIKLNIYGSLASKISKSICVNNISGLGSMFVTKNYKSSFIMFLYKASSFFVDQFYFQNISDYNFFIKNQFSSENNSVLIPGSGVDTNIYKKEKNTRNTSNFTFTFASRLIEEKGILEFISAGKILSKKYDNIKFKIFGDFPIDKKTTINQEKLLNEIKGYKNIYYHGHSDNMIEKLKESNCIVLPTYYKEGTPKVLLEAASLEVPIIATNIAGVNDILSDNFNGFFCNEKDAIDLSKKMEKMYKLSNNQRILFGKNGRELAIKKFDTKILLSIYEKSLNSISQINNN